jgi:hypothetical protein
MIGQRFYRFILLFLILIPLVGCNYSLPTEESSPEDAGEIAAQTLEVVSTQVGSGTEVSSGGPLPLDAISSTDDPASIPLNGDCLNKAVFVEDITFRDNTQIESGATFVKIWRLRNDGTCIWDHTYSLAFIGGEVMSAPSRSTLSQVVQPGQTIDLSVNMVAPEGTGIHQGFWKLKSGSDQFFGIGTSGDQSFWVKINVISSLVATSTDISTPISSPATPEPEQTPLVTISPSPTQEIHFQGTNSLTTSQSIDLDTGETASEEGMDLSLLGSTWVEAALHPENQALLIAYLGEPTPPTLTDCQNSPLAEEPIFISSLAVGDIICYSTDVGRYGYLIVDGLESIFEFTLTTWGP